MHWCCSAFNTFHLWRELQTRLSATRCQCPGAFWRSEKSEKLMTMFDFYCMYWRPLERMLGDMEIVGVGVDAGKISELEAQATEERHRLSSAVRQWVMASSRHLYGDEVAATDNLDMLNTACDSQVRQVLFGGAWNRNPKRGQLPSIADFPGVADAEETPSLAEDLEYSAEIKKTMPKAPRVTIRGLALGLRPTSWTDEGWPSVSSEALRRLVAHQPNVLGAAGVEAVGNLVKIAEVNSMLNQYLWPPQTHLRDGRVFPSLNLMTEMCRLSSWVPNLQHQLLVGRVPVREALVAAPGSALVVADYEHLELRVMAYLAGCRLMVDQLRSGGDLHSRTAVRMFHHIARAVEVNDVTVENFGERVPSVKSLFPSERRLSKMLNFSVLNGITARAVAQDQSMSMPDARKLISDWFNLYPEIKLWKEGVEREAIETGVVRTLLGRTHPVQNVQSIKPPLLEAALRSATITSVQGSVADIVTAAMLKLWKSSLLRDLGYRVILQVHDQIILEGPEDNAHKAMREVKFVMQVPLTVQPVLSLPVSVGFGKTWQDSKP